MSVRALATCEATVYGPTFDHSDRCDAPAAARWEAPTGREFWLCGTHLDVFAREVQS